MKKYYFDEAELEVVRFNANDVICTSGDENGGSIGGDDDDFNNAFKSIYSKFE